MKNQTEIYKSFTVVKSSTIRVLLICMMVTISLNAFSQQRFLKRKYMKGIFIEKKQENKKLLNKNVSYTGTNVSHNLVKQIDTLGVVQKADKLISDKSEMLKNMYEQVIEAEIKSVSIKSVATSIPEKRFYANHNTVEPDTAYYSAVSNAVAAAKNTVSTSGMENKVLQAGNNKKARGEFLDAILESFVDVGLVLLSALVIAGITYLIEMFPFLGLILLVVAVVVVIWALVDGLGDFLVDLIPG
ncbi:MAG: hypothetical protein V4608_03535 [Bacteroidota bacterium]